MTKKTDMTPGQASYGPNNPHPLSTLKTELVWEGKYDEFGNRRELDVPGAAMPFQKIETVDEPRSRIEAQGDLFDTKKAHLDDFLLQLSPTFTIGAGLGLGGQANSQKQI